MTVDNYYEKYWTEAGFLPHGSAFVGLEALYGRVFDRPGRVVDLGCGDAGTSGPYFVRNGWQYHGVDVSTTAVARAGAAGFTASVVEDAAKTPFSDESVDAVVSIEVLEHLFAPQLAAQEVHRILRPGGAFVATVPNVAYWRRRADLAALGRWNPLGDEESVIRPWRDAHIRFFTPKTLQAMLIEAGFADVDVLGLGGSLLRDIPGARRFYRADASPLYKRLERRWPSLWGYRCVAVCRKAP